MVLVLQGGGALGSYQGGVYEAMTEAGQSPAWVAGVSIGAINAALIVGNPPERQVARLREFWTLLSSNFFVPPPAGDWARNAFNQFSAFVSATAGVPGFYRPRFAAPDIASDAGIESLGLYDASALRETLLRFVDFDRINLGPVRLSVGAVNVLTGNSVYFDSARQVIGPEHIMASGALPPAFAPVMVDGEPYWDGGIVSNTPLQYVLDERSNDALRVFQVDLFSARGEPPKDLAGVEQRRKDILYSSRTRYDTDKVAQLENAHVATLELIGRLPEALRNDPAVQALAAQCNPAPVEIVHLIYRKKSYENEAKDYEFSRASVNDHWQAGRDDMRFTREHPEYLARSPLDVGVSVYDIACDRVR